MSVWNTIRGNGESVVS